MFNNIIELIKNSVTTIVGLTVGALGLGGGNVLNVQTANISDAITPVVEEIVVGDGEAVALPVPTPVVSSAVVETEYFDRTDIAPAIFTRPTSNVVSVVSEETPILVQDTSIVRSINPVKSTKKVSETDVSLIIQTDFDKFDPQLKILKITEDENGFYSNYQFNSFAIKDNAWKAVVKEKNISVGKAFLGDQDLEDYLSKQLGEVVDNEIIFLKEVQEIQKAKLAKVAEKESQTIASDYSALIGKVLDLTSDTSVPVQVVNETPKVVAPVVVQNNTTNSGIVDNEAPLIIIQGNNPALIQIGSNFSDLGAKVTDNISNNLGVVVGGDVVNTEVKGSYFVTYTATDEAGNVATATREVIVYDYGVAPEVEQIVPVVETVVEEVVPEVAPVVEIVVEPVIEATTTIEEIEMATTTEEVIPAEIIVDTADVVSEAVSAVVEGSKKVGKKVKKTVETVSEVTSVVVETVADTTTAVVESVTDTATATIDQVSDAVETVAEEVSAMIKQVHFMELIGNIRSSMTASISTINSTLQASVSTAGEGTNSVIKNLGQSVGAVTLATVGIISETTSAVVETITGTATTTIEQVSEVVGAIAENVVEIIDGGVEKTGTVIKKFWQTIGLEEIIFQTYDKMTANISDYKQEPVFVENEIIYKKESFLHFVFRKTIEAPGIVVDKVIHSGNNLTATVVDYSRTVSSDLEVAGEQINNRIGQEGGIWESLKENVAGSVSSVLNFFKNHQPF